MESPRKSPRDSWKVKRFLRTFDLARYSPWSSMAADLVLSRTRFLMTSSTLEELRERRVEKRPWILEKSMETTFIISSIAS